MGLPRVIKSNSAVSEVMGTMLLLLMVIGLFSVVAISVYSLLPLNPVPTANIICQVNGNNITITHQGGDALSLDTKIGFSTFNGSTNYIIVKNYLNTTEKADGKWSIGEKIVYSNQDLLENQIQVTVIDPSSNSFLLSTTVPMANSITVTTLDATGSTLYSENLSMHYDFLKKSGSVRFTIRASDGGWTNTSWIARSGSGSYNYVISSLSPLKLYYFKAELLYNSMILVGEQKSFSTICPGINTSVNKISPYITSVNPLTITAADTSDSDNVTLYYRWSDDNSSWNGGLNEIYDSVDSNTSSIDGSADTGSETNFPNAQGITKDGNSMTIQEADTAGQIHKTAVQGNTCNVDSSPDKGTEINFANAQGITRDSNVMTITEADQGTGTSTMGSTTASGTSYSTVSANYMYGGSFTASSSGEIYQASLYGRGGSATVNTKFAICNSGGTILTNGVSNSVSVTTTAGVFTATYTAGSRPIVQSGSTYWIMVVPDGTLRLYYQATTGGTSKADTTNSYTTPTSPTDATSGVILYRQLNANINNINYQADFEYNWSKANFSDATEYLCFYVTSAGSETLNINYWNGAWTSLGTITGTGWTNISASGLTSKTYTIQLVGATTSNDISQDSWSIDCIFLYSYNASNYKIDFEYQWTAAAYNRINKQVCLYVASHTGAENLLVNYWTGSAWSSLGTISTTGWSNFTATGLSSLTYTIQLKGVIESGDSTQDSWKIDVIMLHTWNTTGGSHGHNWIIWSNVNNPDTLAPWSWNFNFPDGVGYYEFYTKGKIGFCGGAIEPAPASADAICRKT